MYRIIKVLNNNAILALDQEKKREIILLGNGIGFGKHPGGRDQDDTKCEDLYAGDKEEADVCLESRQWDRYVYLEATGRILEEAERY